MQPQENSMRKYYTDQAWLDKERIARETPAEERKKNVLAMRKLFAEIEADIDLDPASERAQDLTKQWLMLAEYCPWRQRGSQGRQYRRRGTIIRIGRRTIKTGFSPLSISISKTGPPPCSDSNPLQNSWDGQSATRSDRVCRAFDPFTDSISLRRNLLFRNRSRRISLPRKEDSMPNSQRSVLAALTLFFIAPLVAEFLLGDFPITFLSPLILMTPFYGGGALLIRELTRRTGRGWPAILLLGCAYRLH